MPRKDLVVSPRYRLHAGMVAWLLHRITGVLLVLYFIVHMLAAEFTSLAAIKNNIIVEAVVVVLFAWHAMNGLRIIFMEFLKAAERTCFKKGVIIFTILAVLISGVGLYYINAYNNKVKADAAAAAAEAKAAESDSTESTSEGE